MTVIYEKVIDECSIEIKISTNEKILARATVDLVNPPIKIKGFTVKKGIDNKSSDETIFVSAPSFRNNFGKSSSIVWMPIELWKLLTEKIISEYRQNIQQDEDFDVNDEIFESL